MISGRTEWIVLRNLKQERDRRMNPSIIIIYYEKLILRNLVLIQENDLVNYLMDTRLNVAKSDTNAEFRT